MVSKPVWKNCMEKNKKLSGSWTQLPSNPMYILTYTFWPLLLHCTIKDHQCIKAHFLLCKFLYIICLCGSFANPSIRYYITLHYVTLSIPHIRSSVLLLVRKSRICRMSSRSSWLVCATLALLWLVFSRMSCALTLLSSARPWAAETCIAQTDDKIHPCSQFPIPQIHSVDKQLCPVVHLF